MYTYIWIRKKSVSIFYIYLIVIGFLLRITICIILYPFASYYYAYLYNMCGFIENKLPIISHTLYYIGTL